MSATPTAAVDKDELRNTLASVIDVNPALVTDDAHLIDELGADSLMALEVVVVLEGRYGVRIDELEMRRITTLGTAYDMLSEKVRAET